MGVGRLAFVVLLAAPPLHAAGTGDARTALRYDRDVRPILADRCFPCHGPDAHKRQGELRLDLLEPATAPREHGPAIVPGRPDESELVRRIRNEDVDERMPPATSSRKPLDDGERDVLARWIEEGARYEPHWSFVPPVRPPVPEVRDAQGCRNEIDRFIRARLDAEGVEPSPEAPPATQLRRLFLDLTGLPPTPEEYDAFLADPRPDRHEQWVAKLLTEEPYRTRYAERMTTPWLDQSRYADTCGIHMDAGRQMWLWRDWVLAAYRDDMPFDRFVTEQLAGDLLPDATEAQKIASGFHRNHVTTDEGGAIAEEYLVEYAVDRASTTGAVFLGLTMGCARCHEHKFDPVSQEEFYRFYSFFNSIEEPGLYSQLPDPKRAFEPFLIVPNDEQKARKAELEALLASEKATLDVPADGEDAERDRFFAATREASGLRWEPSELVRASSTGGATLTPQPDGSVLASGTNPDQDEHELVLRTNATGLRLLALEALVDPSLPMQRVGRAPNGNAVLSNITAEAVSIADPTQRAPVRFVWAWADHEQADGEHNIVTALDPDPLGWAVDAHRREDGRVALFLADEPFGFEGGTEVVVHLAYRSQYVQHTLGRVRLSLGTLAEAGLDSLGLATSDWLFVGPFPTDPSPAGYSAAFGPESDLVLDREKNFGAGNQFWHFVPEYEDGRLNGGLPAGVNTSYVGRKLFVTSARTVTASLGTDDGFRLFLDGVEVAKREVDRSLAADQDRVELALSPGAHTLVLQVVNTGGDAGFAWRFERRPAELAGDLLAALLPDGSRSKDLDERMHRAWRLAFSPRYRACTERIAALEGDLSKLDAEIPRTMVMQELAKPRETYLLMRGAYDRPDKSHVLERGVPAALGPWPEGAPLDRRGLAQWLLSPSNPLVARVAVNRLWELVFGTGLVRTSEDFGHQGEWPSHPELLDWLAVEFRESGWDVQHILTLLVTSATYRESSRVRPELVTRDPEDRWLASFPRKRLGAETIRDQALYVSGLLRERLGGPSVKPYQPEGLWQEVAMVQSNTREYVRGMGEDLWRRSLYTYWKRACPPPSLSAFDAPTREFCTVRRATTNTPLQALVLWNDEQFVEAARGLAERSLGESAADDATRLGRLFLRCAGRTPEPAEEAALARTLERFRERYRADPDAARELVMVGESEPSPSLEPAELAAWTMIASALLNLDEVITRG
jgi:hypothetical protein